VQDLEFRYGRHRIRARVQPPPMGLGLSPRWRVEVNGDERERVGPIYREGEEERITRERIQKWIHRGCRGDF
jgi:hypothetical protein